MSLSEKVFKLFYYPLTLINLLLFSVHGVTMLHSPIVINLEWPSFREIQRK